MTLRLRLCLIALALGLLLGPTGAKAFYDPFWVHGELKPEDELEERLWFQSRSLGAELKARQPEVPLAYLDSRVQAVLDKHFPSMKDTIKVSVFADSELIAATTASGEVFLSTGLVMRLHNEREFAAIIAREIGHFFMRHSARTLAFQNAGATAKELFSTAFGVYNAAIGIADITSIVDDLVGLTPEALVSKLQLSPEMLVENASDIFIEMFMDELQTTARDFARNLGGYALHRLSVAAVQTLVRTSVYGYSDSLEIESDLFALGWMRERYGTDEDYVNVMQRLLLQSKADGEIPYVTFYSNAERLEKTLKSREMKLQAVSSLAEMENGDTVQSMNYPKFAQLGHELAVLDNSLSAETSPSYLFETGTIGFLDSLYPMLKLEAEQGAPERFMLNLNHWRALGSVSDLQLRELASLNQMTMATGDKKEQGIAVMTEHVERSVDWRLHEKLAAQFYDQKDYVQSAHYYAMAISHSDDEDAKVFMTLKLNRAQSKIQNDGRDEK